MLKRPRRVNSNSINMPGTEAEQGFVVIPHHPDFYFGNDKALGNEKPFSMSFWFNPSDHTASTGRPLITKFDYRPQIDGDLGNEFRVIFTSGRVNLLLHDAENAGPNKDINRIRVLSSVQSPPNQWSHAVVTYDGSKLETGMKVYINGVDRTQLGGVHPNAGTVPNPPAVYGGMVASGAPLVIGASAEYSDAATPESDARAQLFRDFMADVCIFSKELSDTEVSEIYNDGKVIDMSQASTYEDLISWWKMGDDLDATGANGIRDYKGSHHGTMSAAASIVRSPGLPSGFEMIEATPPSNYGKKKEVQFITPSDIDYESAILRLTPVQISKGLGAPANGGDIDLAKYPELEEPIMDFMNNPDIEINGISCSFHTQNARFLKTFQDSLPGISNFRIQVWGFSYAMPRWGILTDVHDVDLQVSQERRVQMIKVFEIAGVDKVCVVLLDSANHANGPGSEDAVFRRIFQNDNDHISLAVCNF